MLRMRIKKRFALRHIHILLHAFAEYGVRPGPPSATMFFAAKNIGFAASGLQIPVRLRVASARKLCFLAGHSGRPGPQKENTRRISASVFFIGSLQGFEPWLEVPQTSVLTTTP